MLPLRTSGYFSVSHAGGVAVGVPNYFCAKFLLASLETVPAVIVEVGFLSNAGDALKLSQENFLDTAAEAIADAIEEAFEYDLR